MTITSYPAQRGRDVRDRAEFDSAALAAAPSAPSADPRPTVTALRLRTDGAVEVFHLSPQPRARVNTLSMLTGAPIALGDGSVSGIGGGLEVIRLDEDLDLWCDLDGDRFAGRNPVASVLAAAFGVHDGIHGDVVLTGAQDEHGVTQSISVATSVIVAGTAAASDAARPGSQAQRRREFAALGIAAIDPDGPAGALVAVPTPREPQVVDVLTGRTDATAAAESFDALAHTVTRDGDLPRCPECDEYAPGGHAEHQPEALADPDTDR